MLLDPSKIIPYYWILLGFTMVTARMWKFCKRIGRYRSTICTIIVMVASPSYVTNCDPLSAKVVYDWYHRRQCEMEVIIIDWHRIILLLLLLLRLLLLCIYKVASTLYVYNILLTVIYYFMIITTATGSLAGYPHSQSATSWQSVASLRNVTGLVPKPETKPGDRDWDWRSVSVSRFQFLPGLANLQKTMENRHV